MLGAKNLQYNLPKISVPHVASISILLKQKQSREKTGPDLPNQKVLDGDLLNVPEEKKNVISSLTRIHAQM